MQAQRILVLSEGRVADIGTHEELISRPGIYRDIYDIQMSSDDRLLLGEEAAKNGYDEQEYSQKFSIRTWKRLLPFVSPYKKAFALMLFFNCLTALMDVLLPLFQRYAVDEFIEAGTLNGLWVFALCYLGAIMTQTLAVLGMGRNSMFIEMTVGRDMRRAAFTHLQTLSFSYYNVTPVGYILSRVMSDTMKIAGIIGWAAAGRHLGGIHLTGALISMLLLNWRLALVVIVIVPLIALATAYFQGRLLLWNRRVRKLNSRITGAFTRASRAPRPPRRWSSSATTRRASAA